MRLLIASFLASILLSGCASSDYIQGCYDGLEELIRETSNDTGKFNEWQELRKQKICRRLQEERKQRLEDAHPKNR